MSYQLALFVSLQHNAQRPTQSFELDLRPELPQGIMLDAYIPIKSHPIVLPVLIYFLQLHRHIMDLCVRSRSLVCGSAAAQ